MTEKIAKKIGEAYAFAQVLSDTFSNNTEVMSELLGEHAGSILETTKTQREQLEAAAQTDGTAEIVLPKAEKTGSKITNMGEMYVGDDWDDVAEVLEWMSFFIGGAVIHWQLIIGAAKEMSDSELQTIAETGTEYYHTLLHQLKEYAEEVGKQRAQG